MGLEIGSNLVDLSVRIRRDCETGSNQGGCMEFSAPIFILKQNAKTLARREKIPLHAALDRVAQGEGFKAWSQLAAQWNSNGSDFDLLGKLQSSRCCVN